MIQNNSSYHSDTFSSDLESSSSLSFSELDPLAEAGKNTDDKLGRLMEWFHLNQILPGDPLTIQETYFRQGKSKIASIIIDQRAQNSNQAFAQRRELRKVLSIQTKMWCR